MNKHIQILFLFLSIFIVDTTSGQTAKVDSLENLLKIHRAEDTVRVNLLNEIVRSVYKNDADKALDYANKAVELSDKLNFKKGKAESFCLIGTLLFYNKSDKLALDYFLKALKISEVLKRKQTICETYSKISSIYLLQKEYVKALKYSHKSLELADELKLLANQKDIHHQLSEIYSATNDSKNAYQHYKKYKELNDRILNEKNLKKLAELEYTYKYQKEIQAIELEQQKKDAVQSAIMFSLIAGFVLVSLFAVYVFRSLRIKQKTNLILARQKHEIEELNEEYLVVNEELTTTNEALVETKKMVEENEEKLKLLIKNSNDILVLANGKGEQFFISDVAKNLTGYDVENLLGSVEDVIFPDDLEIVRQHWNRVLANKDIADCIQYRHKHKEKGYVWFEAVTQNFLDHPAIKSVVANIRDITERKNAEIALQESEAAKAQLLTNEIERINRELELNQKSMTAATLKLIQNSECDAQTIERLMEIEKDTNPEGKQKIKALISDNKRISYNSNWDEFEILFEKTHRSFHEKLNAQFPNLTANERKICAFLKLNMSNKDIAQITFQSDDALKKARLRLRQKLGIVRETNLVAFLQNI